MSRLEITQSDGNTSGPVAKVPLELLQALSAKLPIPVTISGANQVTFTVNASASRPVVLLNGINLVSLKTTLAYTWVVGSNNILDSDGAAATLTGSTTGVWYMYIGYNSSGTLILRPSQTAPIPGDGPYGGMGLTHPGSAREQYWTYVGSMKCTTAATPVFLIYEKIGHWCFFAANQIAVPTSPGLMDYSDSVPAYPGVEIQGILATGGGATTDVSAIRPSSTAGRGDILVKAGAAVVESATVRSPIIESGANAGQIYGDATTTAGTFDLNGYKEAV